MIYSLPSSFAPTENEWTSIAEHEAAKYYSFSVQAFLRPALSMAIEKYSFSDDTLRFIVNNNAFVPDGRQESFLKGLVAGFDFDYLTALSILMPQVENAIRELAIACDATVYMTQENGTECSLSLDSVLCKEEVADCLDETMLFNLRLFFSSVYGYNMRNQVAHGLLSDNELNSVAGMAVWWLTLHLCCVFSRELAERLIAQNSKE